MMGRSLMIASVIGLAGTAWSSSGHAQGATYDQSSLGDLIQRFERLDKVDKDEGFVLENYDVEQPPDDPSRNSLKLSIGGFGAKPATPFDDKPAYSIDPTAPPAVRPFGLNLKMKF